MKKFIKENSALIIVIFGIIVISLILFNSNAPMGGRSGGAGQSGDSIMAYVSQSSSNLVIYSGPAYLERIIVGKNDSEGIAVITVSDAITEVGSEPFMNLESATIRGVYEVGKDMTNGIFTTVSGAINATFIYIAK